MFVLWLDWSSCWTDDFCLRTWAFYTFRGTSSPRVRQQHNKRTYVRNMAWPETRDLHKTRLLLPLRPLLVRHTPLVIVHFLWESRKLCTRTHKMRNNVCVVVLCDAWHGGRKSPDCRYITPSCNQTPTKNYSMTMTCYFVRNLAFYCTFCNGFHVQEIIKILFPHTATT